MEAHAAVVIGINYTAFPPAVSNAVQRRAGVYPEYTDLSRCFINDLGGALVAE